MSTQNAKHYKVTSESVTAVRISMGGLRRRIDSFLSSTLECDTLSKAWAQLNKEWDNESRS